MLMEGLVGIVALIAATAMFPGDYFAINTPPAVFAHARDPAGQSAAPRGRGRRERRRPPRRRRVARGRHRADLQRPARHARPDGLLVPLRHHVRGALHPDDDRYRHARRPLSRAGVPRAASTRRSARQEWLPGAMHLDAARRRRRGSYFIWTGSISTIWPMFGIANQLLAVGGARRRHDDHHQHGQARGTPGSRRLPLAFVSVTTLTRRGAERPRQLLADGHRRPTRDGTSRATSTRPDGHDDGLRRSVILERAVALHAGAARTTRRSCRSRRQRIGSLSSNPCVRESPQPRGAHTSAPRRLGLRAENHASGGCLTMYRVGSGFSNGSQQSFAHSG